MLVQAAKIIGSGLATIGLINTLLSVILDDNLLLSKIIYTKLVKEAISIVESMINSLPKDSVLLNFLNEEILSSKLEIIGKNENNNLVVNELIPLDFNNLKYKKLKKDINSSFYMAGVYIFIAPNGEQYVGSCIDFYSRLNAHKYGFEQKIKGIKLYSYNYKYEEYKWSPLYKTMNYYKKFISLYPYYVLSRGEMDILFAITQLIPRILEQSLLLHFSFTLNGERKLIIFSYTNWDIKNLYMPVLGNQIAKQVQIIMNNRVIRTVHSIRKLMDVLGIKSIRTIAKYMNHIISFYSPNLNGFVNIRYPYVEEESLLTHDIIHRKTKNIPELIIPNLSLFSLIPDILYVYNSDLSLIKTYNSIKEGAKDLNPNYKKLGISIRGRETAISRYKNKKFLIYNELGYFYFAKNPNSNDRWVKNQQGWYPLILKDIINKTELEFIGIIPVQKYLSSILNIKPDARTIKSHYIKGTIYRKRYMFIPQNKNN
jgi:hypothetical protein